MKRLLNQSDSALPDTLHPDEQDSAWKDILDSHLRAFLLFFFPPIAADIDWRRGYEPRYYYRNLPVSGLSDLVAEEIWSRS